MMNRILEIPDILSFKCEIKRDDRKKMEDLLTDELSHEHLVKQMDATE